MDLVVVVIDCANCCSQGWILLARPAGVSFFQHQALHESPGFNWSPSPLVDNQFHSFSLSSSHFDFVLPPQMLLPGTENVSTHAAADELMLVVLDQIQCDQSLMLDLKLTLIPKVNLPVDTGHVLLDPGDGPRNQKKKKKNNENPETKSNGHFFFFFFFFLLQRILCHSRQCGSSKSRKGTTICIRRGIHRNKR